MSSQLTNGHPPTTSIATTSTPNANSSAASSHRLPLADLPKSNVFTTNLPPDPDYTTPSASHSAKRTELGPRIVKGALYTFVRPDVPDTPELACVSAAALRDLGISEADADSTVFAETVAGKRILTLEDAKDAQPDDKSIYPWAQCYGGWQFGSWAGQLGDGRAISLFETTNPATNERYELQLKGAGRTPYSRFADGRAVVRSSIREFVVSESLHALGIPTTRALALTLLRDAKIRRESIEPGAIVARFAQTWLRVGTFDLLRARNDRTLTRRLAEYIAEHVFGGWEALPARIPVDELSEDTPEIQAPGRAIPRDTVEGPDATAENRYMRIYREIVRRNARTVAAWQAYAFTNGVLNTDNTSVFGLSLDFGPFAFLDNFDPSYTPNHDDWQLRYSYRNQPTIIWWNLVRLGEDLGELLGSGARCDEQEFVEKGVSESWSAELVSRAEKLIARAGEEYKAVFLAEYKRLMTLRLGLKTLSPSDFDSLFSEWLDLLEALELDFTNSFRKLCSLKMSELAEPDARRTAARTFLHAEGVKGVGQTEDGALTRIADWLDAWRARVLEDWGADAADGPERREAMRLVNPKFIPRGWVLNEVIERVEKKGDTQVMDSIMHLALDPFAERWEGDERFVADAERWCGDVPGFNRSMQCSCSS